MIALNYYDIKKANDLIKNDPHINSLLAEKRRLKFPAENFINFDELLPYLLNDCLIEFISENTKSLPHTYEQFIKELSDKSRNDSTIKRNFNNFYQIKERLDDECASLLYIPPFIAYFCQSLLPNNSNRAEFFRNFNYIYFDADFYLHIIRDRNSIPFFKKDRYVEPKQYEKLVTFFSEISSKPLIDHCICQHYYDQFFSVLLFTQTLNYLNQIVDKKTDALGLFTNLPNINEFMLLCSLIQNTSGIQTKKILFDEVKKIFDMNVPSSDEMSFSSTWKQFAIELMIWNSIVTPYIRYIYKQYLGIILPQKRNEQTCQELYIQFRKEIEASDDFREKCLQSLTQDSRLPQENLFDSDFYTKTEIKKQVREKRLENYKLISNTFYNTAPLKIMCDCSHMTSYSEIYKQAFLDLRIQLLSKQAFLLK